MKDESIRKLTKTECKLLSEIMGYGANSLQEYEGRYTRIILKSPKKIKNFAGSVYRND